MSQDISLDEFSVVPAQGGIISRALERVGLSKLVATSVLTRSLVCIAFTWCVLLTLSLIEGNMRNIPLAVDFLQDLREWCRFLFVIPVLFMAETVIIPWMTHVTSYFVKAGLIDDEDLPAYRELLRRATRRRDSLAIELFLLVFSVATCAAGVTLTPQVEPNLWQVIDGQRTMAGTWYSLGALPIVRFLWLRWLLRIFIWWSLLGHIARLRLRLVPTHPDRAGGLGFVSAGHSKFSILSVAISAQVATGMAEQIIYEGQKLANFEIPIFSEVVILVLFNLAPLMVFSGKLIECKRIGLYEYGILAKRYVDDFHKKWIKGERTAGEEIIGSSDIQSLADLGGSFDMVRDMQAVPFGKNAVLAFLLAALLPFAPLLLTIYPFDQLLLHVLNKLI